jgi:hypothetical protein
MMATRSQSARLSIKCVVRKHRLAALADAADRVPDRAARLRVEAGRQLVEKHQLGIVYQSEDDEEALLLAA